VRVLGLAGLAMLTAGGCAVSKKTAVAPSQKPAVAQTATKAELIARYNQQANAIQSLNATISLKLTAGSAYSGVIEQYHEVGGYILAQRPADIRLIGQAPVVATNIFDMVSDGTTFSVFIPSKNKFLTGPSNFERHTDKPIENLRPQHLVDALLWAPIPERGPVLMEEAAEGAQRFYVLTVVRTAGGANAAGDAASSATDWEVASKIYFDRVDLHVARIETFGAAGRLDSDAQYSGTIAATVASANEGDASAATPGAATNAPAAAASGIGYPSSILLSRPSEDYKLQIEIKKLKVNDKLTPEQFILKQPAGSDLVRVGDDAKDSKGEQHP
jgi:outer membrane lipoprotein-sorting protein